MNMPKTGKSWDKVRATLIERGANDAKWRDGKTAVYVFNAGAEVSEVQHEAYAAYIDNKKKQRVN